MTLGDWAGDRGCVGIPRQLPSHRDGMYGQTPESRTETSQKPKGEGRVSHSDVGWECAPHFHLDTWFSESGRGSDGPVCPSFLKRVMPWRWFQDWGPGSRSQSPTHEEEEKFRPGGKPTSVI